MAKVVENENLQETLKARQGHGFNTVTYPKALRTHMLRLLGPKAILCKASGLA